MNLLNHISTEEFNSDFDYLSQGYQIAGSKVLLKIIKKEKHNDCVLCESAIKETVKVYRTKLNYAISQTYPILWKIRDIKDSFKRDKILLEGIKHLIASSPNYENFYKILHEKIVSYIHKKGIHTLPHHLSNLVENITRTIDITLDGIVDYEVISIDFGDNKVNKKYTDIKKIMAPIKFKDADDFDIFCEIVINISDKLVICFYTDDDEFQKKGKNAYSLLETKLFFKSSWLNIIHTSKLT